MIKPILHLKMEGNADDSSGNNNHGTVTGATLTTDRFGRGNSAYEFDGTDDYINCGEIITDNLSTFSLCAWVSVDSLSNTPTIFAKYYNGNNRVELTIATDGSIWFSLSNGSTYVDVYGVATLCQNMWFNVLATYDGATTNIYVNGELYKSQAVSDMFMPASYNMDIGRRVANVRNLDGKLDDIRIYDVALTPTQVKFLYDSTKRKYK